MSATSTQETTIDNPTAKTLSSNENKTQSYLFNGLALLCVALALWVIVENASVSISAHLFNDTYNLSLSALLAGIGILCATATGLRFLSTIAASSKQSQASQRRVERLEVTAESSTERVKVLEHKIETLETALKKAIANNKQKS